MNQSELNRAVAGATGESLSTIQQRGFTLLTPIPIEREPLVMDWDEYDQERSLSLLQPRVRQPVAA